MKRHVEGVVTIQLAAHVTVDLPDGAVGASVMARNLHIQPQAVFLDAGLTGDEKRTAEYVSVVAVSQAFRRALENQGLQGGQVHEVADLPPAERS